jgi:gas vesicle protein
MSETTETTSKTGSVLVAFAAGALAGAAAAILLAPRTGRDTREAIRNATKGTRDLAKRMPAAFRGAREAFSHAVNGEVARASGNAAPTPLQASGS